MNTRLYARLARTGIRSERELYRPYLLAAAAMCAIFYILLYLSHDRAVLDLQGGAAISTLLANAVKGFGLFSLLCLLYLHVAILRRRRRAFGLYNVLGMHKGNILRVLAWENGVLFLAGTGLGLAAGILLSKLAELAIAAIMGQHTGYALSVSPEAMGIAVLVFLGIHLLVFAAGALQVRSSNVLALLASEAQGEKPLGIRRLPAVAGFLLIAGGYLLSLTTFGYVKQHLVRGLTGAAGGDADAALSSIFTFLLSRVSLFALLTGLGTLLLFTAGSVFLCQILRRRRRYYYQTAHFVTVSQMMYRMKRNGVSLAVICVLCTLLLITITGAVGFFSGVRGIVDRHYPHDLSLYAEAPSDAAIGEEAFAAALMRETAQLSETAEAGNLQTADYFSVLLFASYTGGTIDLTTDILAGVDPETGTNRIYQQTDGVLCVRVMGQTTYEKLTGERVAATRNELLLVCPKRNLPRLTQVRDMSGRRHSLSCVTREIPVLTPVPVLDGYPDAGGIETVLLVVPDLQAFFAGFDRNAWSDKNQVRYLYQWDAEAASEAAEEDLQALAQRLDQALETIAARENLPETGTFLRIERMGAAAGLSGGLLFLAILLTAMMIFVTVLIMYYKQLSEGYEDRRRFVIMRKIGMTGEEVRRTVAVQMRTVFFFPLMMAGIHLLFAIPLVRLLLMWTVKPAEGVIPMTAGIGFLAFAGMYLLAYLLTAGVYYRIVRK